MMPSSSASIVVVMVVLVAVLLLLLLLPLRHTVAVVVVRMVVVVTRTSSRYVNLSLVLSAASGDSGSGDSVAVLFEHRFQTAVGNAAVDDCGRKSNVAATAAAAVVVVVVIVMIGVGACAAAVETVGGRRCGEHASGESDEELRDDSLQPYIL
jgi:hypothetical protein